MPALGLEILVEFCQGVPWDTGHSRQRHGRNNSLVNPGSLVQLHGPNGSTVDRVRLGRSHGVPASKCACCLSPSREDLKCFSVQET